MVDKHNILDDGYYVGIRSSVRNFSFKLPKVTGGASDDLTLDQLWSRLNHGSKVTSAPQPSVNNATGESSTCFSGWKKVTAAKQTSDKAYAADIIYRAAGGDDPEQAKLLVKTFKQKAANVLARCADNGTFLDKNIENEINSCACVVHEIKVLLLKVSSTDNGGRFDQNTGKWYAETTMRKFYISLAPLRNMLETLASEIADASTNVNPEGKLVAVRVDGRTPRTGRNASTSGFRIERVNSFGDSDEGLRTIIERLKKQISTS